MARYMRQFCCTLTPACQTPDHTFKCSIVHTPLLQYVMVCLIHQDTSQSTAIAAQLHQCVADRLLLLWVAFVQVVTAQERSRVAHVLQQEAACMAVMLSNACMVHKLVSGSGDSSHNWPQHT
jgi:hypothetical protein